MKKLASYHNSYKLGNLGFVSYKSQLAHCCKGFAHNLVCTSNMYENQQKCDS